MLINIVVGKTREVTVCHLNPNMWIVTMIGLDLQKLWHVRIIGFHNFSDIVMIKVSLMIIIDASPIVNSRRRITARILIWNINWGISSHETERVRSLDENLHISLEETDSGFFVERRVKQELVWTFVDLGPEANITTKKFL